MHSKDAAVEEILVWPPYDYVTDRAVGSAELAGRVSRNDRRWGNA